MRKDLDIADLGDLLEQPILAILATRRKNGDTLLSPVWHEWSEGGFSIVTWSNDVKSKNIQANPRVTVLVAESEPPYRSLEVTGEAKLLPIDEPMPMLVRMGRRYRGEQGEAYVEGYRGVAMELIRVEPGTIRAWDFSA